MSKIEKDKCDSCGRTTSDYYAEIGWIRFDVGGSLTITLTKGRGEMNKAETIYYRADGNLDFCSIQCLNEWIQKEKKG